MPIETKTARQNVKSRTGGHNTAVQTKKGQTAETKKEPKSSKKEEDIIQWYINNNIDEKKKKVSSGINKKETNNNDINGNSEYEDIEISKNVEEYINVVCRIKNDVEQNEYTLSGDVDVVKKVTNQKLIIDTFQIGTADIGNFEYTYDRVYDISNNNHYIFNDYIKNNIKNVFQGINCSILAYGQTNSGKTYTMLGNFEFINNLYKLCIENKENTIKDKSVALTYDELTNCICNEPHNIGIVPACINYIFNYINYHKQKKKGSFINNNIKEFVVTLSIIEIYNEVIYDLISGESNLLVQTIDPNKNDCVIKNLKEVEIDNLVGALHYLEQGVKNRKMAFTNMNKTSSRSHLIFIIKVNRYILSTNVVKCGKLCLVDLAGSERLKQTKATGSVKIEATMINKSLTVLSKVINALAVMQIKEKAEKKDNKKEDKENKEETENETKIINEKIPAENENENETDVQNSTEKEKNSKKKNKAAKNEQQAVHIPYRDSKLTRVLSDSLGNNCKSLLICTLAAQLKYVNETASTIKFAQRAKMVKAKPIIREEKIEDKTEKDEQDKKGKGKKKKNGVLGENETEENERDTTINQLDEKYNKNNIFFNFNYNNILHKDLILFCFHLCIFSYICGYRSTGKIEYLNFFIESYKNKIEIIKQQLENKTKEMESNDINDYLKKTFDELKAFTEEERTEFAKRDHENRERLAKENIRFRKKENDEQVEGETEKDKKNEKQKEREKEKEEKEKENEKEKEKEKEEGKREEKKSKQKTYAEDVDSKAGNAHNSDQEKIGDFSEKLKETKETTTEKKEEKSKLTFEYLNKYNEQSHYNKHATHLDSKQQLIDNIAETHLSKDEHNEHTDIDDEDALFGDILIKMKNDICNILKYNFTILNNISNQKNKKEEQKYNQFITFVNKVKENNSIFLLNELKELNDEDNPKNKEKDQQNEDIHNSNYNQSSLNKTGENAPNEKETTSKKDQNIQQEKAKEKEKISKGKKILKTTKNLKDKLLIKHENPSCNSKKENKSKVDLSENVGTKEEHIKENDDENENEKEQELIEDALNRASQVLSVHNIKNIFEYINNNFCKFISDFTTDKSSHFTNFDLNENIDKNIIQKRETIYNFIHASTMFQNTNTLKTLTSNFFYNKLQSELHNFQSNANIQLAKSMHDISDIITPDNMKKTKDANVNSKNMNNNNNTTNTNETINSNKKKQLKNKEAQELEQKQQTIKIENIVESVIPPESITKTTQNKEKKKVRISYQKQHTDEDEEIETKITDKKKEQNENTNKTIYEMQNDFGASKQISNFPMTKTSPEINTQTIHVYPNEKITEFTKLMENEEFKKLYDYLTNQEDMKEGIKNDIYDKKTAASLLELESKLTDEIKKINESITVNIIDNRKNSTTNNNNDNNSKNNENVSKTNAIKEQGQYLSIKDHPSNIFSSTNVSNPTSISKQLENMELTYLEKKRKTHICIKNIWNKFYKLFQKKGEKELLKESIAKNIKNYDKLFDMNIGINKNLLQQNLDSYNVRNFFINNKKVYLLNESEYAHLQELIKYKNIIISLLTAE